MNEHIAAKDKNLIIKQNCFVTCFRLQVNKASQQSSQPLIHQSTRGKHWCMRKCLAIDDQVALCLSLWSWTDQEVAMLKFKTCQTIYYLLFDKTLVQFQTRHVLNARSMIQTTDSKHTDSNHVEGAQGLEVGQQAG